MDEHAQGLLAQIINKFFLIIEYMIDNIDKEDILPVLSVIGTMMFIIVVGYFMAYLVRLEDENIKKKQNRHGGNNNNHNIGKNLARMKTNFSVNYPAFSFIFRW